MMDFSTKNHIFYTLRVQFTIPNFWTRETIPHKSRFFLVTLIQFCKCFDLKFE